jgi:cell division protein ZapA (FtsZ GTPase activity inhibitor)
MLNKNNIKINFICLLSFAIALICTSAFGAEIESKSYPLFLNLDGNDMLATSLYLKCDVVDYGGVPYSEFKSKETGEREKVFVNAIGALKRNSHEDIFQLSHKKRIMTAEELEKHNEKVARVKDNFREVMTNEFLGKNFEKAKVFQNIYLGKSSFMVFGTDETNPESPHRFYRLIMKLKPDSSNKISWDVEKPTETRFIIQTLVIQMAESPELFTRDTNEVFDFEIPLPGAEDGRTAYLQFNGKRYNVNVFKEQVDPLDEIANLFQLQFVVVRDSRELLADLYGGRARKLYLEWIETARLNALEPGRSNYLDGYFKEMTNVDRTLRFDLDADPLYIVFFQKQGNEKLMHQFIVRDPVSGELGFRNIYVDDFFKQWLDSDSVQNSLSDLILDDE